MAGCLGAILFDLFLRVRNQSEDARLIAPAAGGHIWFVPVWAWGTIIGAIGGMMWMGWL